MRVPALGEQLGLVHDFLHERVSERVHPLRYGLPWLDETIGFECFERRVERFTWGHPLQHPRREVPANDGGTLGDEARTGLQRVDSRLEELLDRHRDGRA